MSETFETPIARLNTALDDVAAALAAADLDGLLAAEPRVAAALDGLTAAGNADREALERARVALLRCRRLGAGLVAFTRLSLEPVGAPAYSRLGGGNAVTVPTRGSSMEVRG